MFIYAIFYHSVRKRTGSHEYGRERELAFDQLLPRKSNCNEEKKKVPLQYHWIGIFQMWWRLDYAKIKLTVWRRMTYTGSKIRSALWMSCDMFSILHYILRKLDIGLIMPRNKRRFFLQNVCLHVIACKHSYMLATV